LTTSSLAARGPAAVAELIRTKAAGSPRVMVAIAGPPGSGKSTLAEHLRDVLVKSGETAAVVPMDGFHFDDAVLNSRGHRARKGAPFTFDVAGFRALLTRIRACEPDVAIPIFDRRLELSRNAAAIVDGTTQIILIEGNYLLLNKPPWRDLRSLFDFTILLSVPLEELERRLVRRWLEHGFDMAYATSWVGSNDLPNIREVLQGSGAADLTI
jgi:pantothenate kinase